MQKTLIAWLFTSLVVVLFAVLNAAPVAVNLLFGTVQVSLAIIIVLPLFLGAATGYTLDLVSRGKRKKNMKELEKKLAAAESELSALRTKALPESDSAPPAAAFPE